MAAKKTTIFVTAPIYWAKVLGEPRPNYDGDAREWTVEVEVTDELREHLKTHRLLDRIKDKNEAYKALLKRVADYVYFEGSPKFGRCQWDSVFKHNIYRRLKGQPLRDVPPTFCGCGYFYLAINNKGEIYPCDFFANFPEFKIGDVFNGFNETSLFFQKMGERIS